VRIPLFLRRAEIEIGNPTASDAISGNKAIAVQNDGA